MNEEPREVFLLPEGYDPNDDEGLFVVQQFLDWETPPTRTRVVPVDKDHWVVQIWDGQRQADR